MSNPNRFNHLVPGDLSSPEIFRTWIKKNLADIYLDKKVPNQHLLIFLDYVSDLVYNNRSLDRTSWLSLIRNLESKIKSINNLE